MDLVKNLNLQLTRVDLPQLTPDQKIYVQQLLKSVFSENVTLVAHGERYGEKLHEIVKNNENDCISPQFACHQLAMLGNVHQKLKYTRQSYGYRIIESINSLLMLMQASSVGLAGMTLRLALESALKQNKLNRILKMNIDKAEKEFGNINNANWTGRLKEERKSLGKIINLLSEIDSKSLHSQTETYVDWEHYLNSANVRKYNKHEEYMNIEPDSKYSEEIRKLDSFFIDIKSKLHMPHGIEGWDMAYAFLCDFSHPSLGSRLIGTSGNLHNKVCFDIREMHFIANEESFFKKMVSKTILQLLVDVIMLYQQIDDFTRIYNEKMKILCQKYIRISLKYLYTLDQASFKQITQKWPPYEICLCLNETSKFKFCCANSNNW